MWNTWPVARATNNKEKEMLVRIRNILIICIGLAALVLGGSSAAKAFPAGPSVYAVPVSAPVSAAMVRAPLILSCSTANFGGATNFSMGTSPSSVAVGDFNRDGN